MNQKRLTTLGLTTLVLMLVFGFIRPQYLSGRSLLTMLRTMAYPGIIAIGLAMCLIGGTIDLSVGAMTGLSAVTAASLLIDGWSLWLAMTASVSIGMLVGYINALLVIKLGLTTFIATIGTQFMLRGVILWITKGYYLYPLPDIVGAIGDARPLGVSWAFVIFVALLVLFQLLLSGTVWGLTVRATGSDREVARCTEVNVDRVQTQLHIIASVLAAVAGLLILCKLGGGQPTIGLGIELTVIAGCAIGGVSLFGYEGSMPAVFLGLLFLQAVLMGGITSGISTYLQPTVQGVLMLTAVLFDARHSQQKIFARREI